MKVKEDLDKNIIIIIMLDTLNFVVHVTLFAQIISFNLITSYDRGIIIISTLVRNGGTETHINSELCPNTYIQKGEAYIDTKQRPDSEHLT